MATVPMTLRCLSSTGTLVLDCTIAAGYEVASLDPIEGRWRRTRLTSDDVDGHLEQQAVRETVEVGLVVRIRGLTTSQAETRWTSLKNAIEARRWRLELGLDGAVETWAADRADWTKRREWVDLHHAQREIALRVPVQPVPL